MKNQLFYLFYEKENDLNLKLIKNYVNRFIIDEEADCEVIKVYELTKPTDFEFSEITLIRKFQNLFSYSKLMTLCELIKSGPPSRSVKDQNMQMHYVFALSFDFDMFFFFICVPSFAHCSMLWNRSKSLLSEKDVISFPKHGSGKQQFTNSHVGHSNVTIGDDIDFFIEKFRNMKPNPYIWERNIVFETLISKKGLKLLEHIFGIDILYNDFNQEFEHLSISTEAEDSFVRIQCQRKFIPRPTNMARSFVFICILSFLMLVGFIVLNYYIGKIFNPRRSPFDQSCPISFCLFWTIGLGSFFVQLKFFQKFCDAMQNLIFFLEAMLTLCFPNTWLHIIHILNPLLLCLYLYAYYFGYFRKNYYFKTLLNYIETSIFK